MMIHLQSMYESHHAQNRGQGFTIMKRERGQFFSSSVGKGKKVLDLGCRDGALTAFFVNGNRVIGADIDRKSLDRAKTSLGIETAVMDIYGDWQEIGNQKFDVIVMGEVLEHLFHPEEIVKKVHGHLYNGGIFVGSVPNAFSLKNRIRLAMGRKMGTPLSDPTHINHFSISELRRLLNKHFSEVGIFGLGRYEKLAGMMPGFFAFDLAFVAKKKHE